MRTRHLPVIQSKIKQDKGVLVIGWRQLCLEEVALSHNLNKSNPCHGKNLPTTTVLKNSEQKSAVSRYITNSWYSRLVHRWPRLRLARTETDHDNETRLRHCKFRPKQVKVEHWDSSRWSRHRGHIPDIFHTWQ